MRYLRSEKVIRHEGLNKCRVIRDIDLLVVEEKADAQMKLWDEMWRRRCERDSKLSKKAIAVEKTKEAEEVLGGMRSTLKNKCSDKNAFSWRAALDEARYSKAKPVEKLQRSLPNKPQDENLDYKPRRDLWSLFSKKVREERLEEVNQRIEEARQRSSAAYDTWQKECDSVKLENQKRKLQYIDEFQQWAQEKDEYFRKKLKLKEEYFIKLKDATIDYFEMVLSHHQSSYLEAFPQEFDIDYVEESGMLLVDYFLPSRENIPSLKEVKYITSKDEFCEVKLSEKALNEIYDDLLYQLTLLAIYQLYKADEAGAISSIVFNGYVKFVDKRIGKETTACILSVQAFKDEFVLINLGNVEPKECFRKLKGVGSSKLHGLAAVAPIMQINKEDKRFITPYTVANGVSEATNLAAMDWQDFENLIREIFEKEFSVNGGEVKITRTSRDEGVDAVAFDPDPVRGGKIIIQAKRYTNTVGVSAVRDLFGTVMNEGAMKGILVTTTDYGPDAYKFAQDKPLTLLNGSNLLHLLGKHGHKAKIDIKEARKTLNLKDKDENRNY